MSAVSLTIKALLAQSGITAIVGQRVYPFPLPHGAALPAIAVAMSAEDETYLLSGASQYPEAAVQVHCVAQLAKDAIQLGEVVKVAMRDRRFTSGSNEASFQKDGPDFTDFADDLSTHRRVMGFTVRWR